MLNRRSHRSIATIDTTSVAPHRYLVLYRNATIPGDAEARIAAAGAHLIHRNEHFGIAAVQSATQEDDATTLRRLAAQPNVDLRPPRPHRLRPPSPSSGHRSRVHQRSRHIQRIQPAPSADFPLTAQSTPHARHRLRRPYDTYYTTPRKAGPSSRSAATATTSPAAPRTAHGTPPWAKASASPSSTAASTTPIPTSPPTSPSTSPRSTSPPIPAACDDGTPQDQKGHGTWTASLAAAAIGPGTGQVIGVAPAATILNIKVLQRMPATITGDTNPADQCAAGEASGLLSWVMQGIEDAITNRADVISLSLGTTADLTTGDGAGLHAAFNRSPTPPTQANIVLVASAGNDGFDLSNPRYVELPAQARGVLAIVASTNPACAQNTTPGATCAPGPVTLAYYSNYGAPSTPSPPPAAAIPPAATPTSAAGFAEPAAPANPTPPTASPQTPPTATAASISATPPTFRPWEPAPQPHSPPESPPCSAPPTPTGPPPPSSPPCATQPPPHPACPSPRSTLPQLTQFPQCTSKKFLQHLQSTSSQIQPLGEPLTYPFIRSFTLCASFSISSAFLITSTDKVSLSSYPPAPSAPSPAPAACPCPPPAFCRSVFRNFSCCSARCAIQSDPARSGDVDARSSVTAASAGTLASRSAAETSGPRSHSPKHAVAKTTPINATLKYSHNRPPSPAQQAAPLSHLLPACILRTAEASCSQHLPKARRRNHAPSGHGPAR